MLFDFLLDANNYEQRKVDRFEQNKLIVDTCRVSDSPNPYETGIKHPAYNQGKWVIVEEYKLKEQAQIGHDKWIKILTAKKLAKKLKDISSAEVAQLRDAVSKDNWRIREKSNA